MTDHLDWFFQRYGWDYDTYMRQPKWFLARVTDVVEARHDVAERKAAAEAAKDRAKKAS